MSTDVYIDVDSEKISETFRIGHLSVFLYSDDFNLLEWLKWYSNGFPILTDNTIETIIKMAELFNETIADEEKHFRSRQEKWGDPRGSALPFDDIPSIEPLREFLFKYKGLTWATRVD